MRSSIQRHRRNILRASCSHALRSACAIAVAAVFLSTTAVAQPVASDTRPGHGVAGVGVLLSTGDAAERTRFPGDSGAGVVPLIEAAVFVAPRVAVGVEALSLGTLTNSSDTLCCMLREQEREASILATARWRALRRKQLGIDAVFGFGTVIQHRDTEMSLRFVPGSETRTIEDRRFPAVGLGVDVPVWIIRHAAISPLARVYFLERGEPTTTNVERTSSTRVAVGVTIGVTW